jgi:hypothetical protein
MHPEMEPPEPSPPLPPRFEREPSPPPPRYERQPKPPFVPRPVDPIAAIAGNATALGLGYMLMRRRRLAAVAIIGTAFFLFALAANPDSLLWRFLFGFWWFLMCLHAWHLTRGARSEPPTGRRRDRWIAVSGAGFVLFVVVGVHADAWRIVRDAENAHAAGDCDAAVNTLARFNAGHAIAHGAKVAEVEQQRETCNLLIQARAQGGATGAATMAEYMDRAGALWDGAGIERAAMLFDAAIAGRDLDDNLNLGFEQLNATLETEPGQNERVRETVEQLITALDTDTQPCHAVTIDDWLRAQTWEAPELAEPIAAAAARVPVHLLECARDRSTTENLSGAQEVYQRFIAEHPDHAEFQAATDELYAVESQIEFEHVQDLLNADEYCEAPAPWRGANAYGGAAPHPMWVIGLSAHDLPAEWTTSDVTTTEIVVCVDGPERGRFLESCYYEGGISAFQDYTEVSFYATRFKVKVFELRTGKQVDSYTEEFDGDPCPEFLEYTTYGGFDHGPPSEVEAEVSDADVRSVFERLQD